MTLSTVLAVAGGIVAGLLGGVIAAWALDEWRASRS